jgi:multidrug efflux pump
VARVEAGPEDERKLVRFNRKPAVGLGIIKQSKANTLDVARAVKAELEELRKTLPPGLSLDIGFDSSIFIERSLDDVRESILESIILVVIVIYLFLRSFRATIIPAIAIPVSLIGTLAILYFCDFSINTLTLMGFTLAIGIVVDDAIVVLENASRLVDEGMPPREAARVGMDQIAFAVIAATISVIAVFLPLAFLTDKTGRPLPRVRHHGRRRRRHLRHRGADALADASARACSGATGARTGSRSSSRTASIGWRARTRARCSPRWCARGSSC